MKSEPGAVATGYSLVSVERCQDYPVATAPGSDFIY
jgi:hypothetical protein